MKHKIAITSDNHINWICENQDDMNKIIAQQVKFIKKKKITHLIINGDISWDKKQIQYYLSRMSYDLTGKCEISYNIGNHDLSQNYTLKQYCDIEDSKYLPNNEIVLEDEKIVIIGNDGFFDYTFLDEYANKQMIDELNQYANNRYFNTKNNIDPIKITNKLLSDAEKLLKKYSEKGYRIIYATHYIPKKEFVLPNSMPDKVFKNALMGSKHIGELLEKYAVSECYFGHTHRHLGSKTINGVTYHCNPVGLKHNWVQNGFNNSDFLSEWKRTLSVVYDNTKKQQSYLVTTGSNLRRV